MCVVVLQVADELDDDPLELGPHIKPSWDRSRFTSTKARNTAVQEHGIPVSPLPESDEEASDVDADARACRAALHRSVPSVVSTAGSSVSASESSIPSILKVFDGFQDKTDQEKMQAIATVVGYQHLFGQTRTAPKARKPKQALSSEAKAKKAYQQKIRRAQAKLERHRDQFREAKIELAALMINKETAAEVLDDLEDSD